ncbi:hypothetical protein C8J57DRAFT_1519112 [Mycena rebaudengoi]|nr:hypothetical protein C8J57DRAFT_1519112 [Mycena rebaudengoi]
MLHSLFAYHATRSMSDSATACTMTFAHAPRRCIPAIHPASSPPIHAHPPMSTPRAAQEFYPSGPPPTNNAILLNTAPDTGASWGKSNPKPPSKYFSVIKKPKNRSAVAASNTTATSTGDRGDKKDEGVGVAWCIRMSSGGTASPPRSSGPILQLFSKVCTAAPNVLTIVYSCVSPVETLHLCAFDALSFIQPPMGTNKRISVEKKKHVIQLYHSRQRKQAEIALDLQICRPAVWYGRGSNCFEA